MIPHNMTLLKFIWLCTVSVSSPNTSYYENWPGPNPISRVCVYRNGTYAYLSQVPCHSRSESDKIVPVSFYIPTWGFNCSVLNWIYFYFFFTELRMCIVMNLNILWIEEMLKDFLREGYWF